MAANEEIKVGLAIVSDSAGTARARKELEGVRKEIDNLKTAFNNGDKSAAEFSKELTKLEKQEKGLKGAINAVTGEYTREAAAMKTAASEAKKLAAEQSKLERAGFETGLGQFGPEPAPKPGKAGSGLRAAGRGLRNLPSVQIPGAGIGTDAIGNITRLVGTFTELTSASATAGKASAALTPLLGAQTAATVAAYAPIALLLGGLVAIGAGLKSFADSTSQNAEQITALADAQLDLNTRIAKGLSTAEAQKELDELTKAQERNKDTQADLQKQYDESQKAIANASNEAKAFNLAFSGAAGIVSGQTNALGAATKVFSGDEQSLADSITNANKAVTEGQAKIDILTKAMNDGSLAANDAAEAERKLSEERTSAVLENAAAAGQEEAARRKALDATEEQNQKRLESIEDERAAIEAQLAVLKGSGDTSEKVSDQIAKLTGSLSSLGKESSFIKDTALAASRARDAEKKAAKEAEDAAKKSAAAQEKYTEKIKDAGKNFRQATQDIARKAGDAAKDASTKFGRDLSAINQKLNDDEIGATIKANNDEQAALKDHIRSLEDIRRKADESEEEARENRNFLDLTRARRAAQRELNEQGLATKRGGEDRRDAFREEQQERLRQMEIARRDRITAYGQEAEDFHRNVEREMRDARIAKNRQLQEAAAAYNAEQKQLQQHLSSMLQMRGQAYTAERKIGGATYGSSYNIPTATPWANNYNQTTNNITAIGTGGMLATLRAAGYGR